MNKLATFMRDFSFASFMLPLSIVLFIFGFVWMGSVNRSQGFVNTDAVVTKTELAEEAYTDNDGTQHDATYDVYVKYTVDGKEYEEELGTFPDRKVGDKVTVSYNPKDPTDIVQPMSMVVPVVFLIAGAAVLVGGIVSIILTVKKRKALKSQEQEWSHG